MSLDAFRVGVMGASDLLQALRDGGCYLSLDEEARLLDALETEESARCVSSKLVLVPRATAAISPKTSFGTEQSHVCPDALRGQIRHRKPREFVRLRLL